MYCICSELTTWNIYIARLIDLIKRDIKYEWETIISTNWNNIIRKKKKFRNFTEKK